MTLGLAPKQADLFRTTATYCDERVAPDSIYGLLHRECANLFPDAMFADLFTDVGRHSVPPMIVAVVMVLQRVEGCSDREAVDRFAFDVRWKYAAGGLEFDYPGFVHTVLVDMRARLARSTRPNRIFEVTLEAAQAGRVGRPAPGARLHPALRRGGHHGHRHAGPLGDPRPARRRRRGWRPSCGPGCAATTTTRLRASRWPTTTTRPPGPRWSTRWPRMPTRCWTPWTGGLSRARPGRGAAGRGRRPGPRPGRGRGVPDRPAGRQGPGHLHRRPAGPTRAQDLGPRLRRIQRPRRGRPRHRARHRHHGHPGQHRRRRRGR